jgi:hypothetical protein
MDVRCMVYAACQIVLSWLESQHELWKELRETESQFAATDDVAEESSSLLAELVQSPSCCQAPDLVRFGTHYVPNLF